MPGLSAWLDIATVAFAMLMALTGLANLGSDEKRHPGLAQTAHQFEVKAQLHRRTYAWQLRWTAVTRPDHAM